LDTADVYIHQKQLDAAANILREGLKLFPSGTTEEVRLKIQLTDVELARGAKLETIISNLNAVTPDHYSFESFKLAKLKLADIYLKEKNDSKKFIRCLMEIREKYPNNADCYMMLGDAYMQVQESEEAIRVFQEFSHKFPEKSSQLAGKVGLAWIKTHNFRKVIYSWKDQGCFILCRRFAITNL
jgi:tetratricopeptide (TPR) repeat protein